MNDDNPLWYDGAEPDDEPGPCLLLLAAAFSVLVGAIALVRRIIWLPDTMWLALSARIARFVRRGRPARH